jgi:hypothetical protein
VDVHADPIRKLADLNMKSDLVTSWVPANTDMVINLSRYSSGVGGLEKGLRLHGNSQRWLMEPY